MTEDDVLSSRSFTDGIACGTFAIDIHPPEGQEQIFTGSGKAVYEIPYRSLIPKGYDNLLVAGRCISANHAAFGSARVMATSMGIGQGAGTAAAISIQKNQKTRDVNIDEVRSLLLEQGQYLLDSKAEPMINPELIFDRGEGSGKNAGHY